MTQRLHPLLRETGLAVPPALSNVEVSGVSCDSRRVGAGTLFIGLPGSAVDGGTFWPEALAAGACCAVIGPAAAQARPPADHDPVLVVAEPVARWAGLLAAAFWQEPSQRLRLIGVTGTNGKTTTTHLIEHLAGRCGAPAALFGTLVNRWPGQSVTAQHTTAFADALQAQLAQAAEAGARIGAMEVSSHALDQQRISGCRFAGAVFTNLTQDHLDYHRTMEAYFEAKASWFHDLAADPHGKKPVAVINTDDAHGSELATALDGKMPVIRYGFNVHCDYRANNFRQSPRGMEFELTAKGRSFLVRAPYIGRFNVYNLLGAIAAANVCGIRPREAVAAVAKAPQVPGRMENVGNAGGATVFVDYAHTPDALRNACRTLRELGPRRLITVFGCGGDRDRGKRPLMAAAAAEYSDACVITSDNPRSEDPLAIIREVEPGMAGKGHLSIPDRAEAIAHAVRNALSGDIILIAGKGHETTQQFADTTIDFDDLKHASKALRDRAQTIAENR